MNDYQRHPDPKAQLRDILAGKSTTPKKATPRHKQIGPPANIDTLTLTFPLPPKECWPNRSNLGWRVVAKGRKWLKAVTVLECQRQEVPQAMLRECTAQPTFYFADRRQRDKDGCAAALKSLWDGLESYGLIENDKHLTPLVPVLAYDKENPRLEITIQKGGEA